MLAEYQTCRVVTGIQAGVEWPNDVLAWQLLGVAQATDALGRLRIDTRDDVVTVSAGDIAHLRPLSP